MILVENEAAFKRAAEAQAALALGAAHAPEAAHQAQRAAIQGSQLVRSAQRSTAAHAAMVTSRTCSGIDERGRDELIAI
jgi:hypothetical protein